MMKNKIKDLDFSDGCYLYLAESSASEITNWGWQFENMQPSTIVRFVRGDKMKTVNSLFDEFSAALQFPYYFGENWNAFRDCILDLDWLSGENYIIVITNSSELLVENSSDEKKILVEYLQEAGEEFNREGKSFFTLFQCNENVKADAKNNLAATGATFQEIKV